MLAALRLGLHQLLFMDGVADHAAVAESVDLAKDAGRRGHGLVNAVLRRATREGRRRSTRSRSPRRAEAALRHSHPRVARARPGGSTSGADEARALMRADNEPAESAARVNTLRATRAEVLEELAGAGVAARGGTDLAEGVVLRRPV